MTEQNTTGTVQTPPEDAVPGSMATETAPTVPAPAAAPAEEIQDAVPEQGAVPGQGAPPEPPATPKDRRKLFAALRWTAAVLVFATVGTGVAYGITQPERTDIPGLSTKDDGRWVYPVLAKPELPPGASLPFAKDNPKGIHYAGLTQLLLPPPSGSTPDSTLKLEKDEVATVDTFLAEYQDSFREKLKEQLTNEGLRQIVARGWTTPDGTRTRIYLLRFHSRGFVSAFQGCGPTMGLNSALVLEADPEWRKAKSSQRNDVGSGGDAPGVSGAITTYQERKPVGDEQTKLACLQSGDIQGLVLQARKGEVAAVPFHQTVILQHQLLG